MSYNTVFIQSGVMHTIQKFQIHTLNHLKTLNEFEEMEKSPQLKWLNDFVMVCWRILFET